MALVQYKYRERSAADVVAVLPEYVNHTPTYPDPTLVSTTKVPAEIVVSYDSDCKTDLDQAMEEQGDFPIYVGVVP